MLRISIHVHVHATLPVVGSTLCSKSLEMVTAFPFTFHDDLCISRFVRGRGIPVQLCQTCFPVANSANAASRKFVARKARYVADLVTSPDIIPLAFDFFCLLEDSILGCRLRPVLSKQRANDESRRNVPALR